MKAVILAGGLGTRISEETHLRPKPMVEIGGKPILWHIMKIYSHHGINEFIVCCGYKGFVIKEYFANYFLHMSDVTFHMRTNSMEVHQKNAEPWEVTLVDTGENTMTGGRLRRVRDYIKDETFCFTYGDGLSDVDVSASIVSHLNSGRLATSPLFSPPADMERWNWTIETKSMVSKKSPRAMGDGSTVVFLCCNLVYLITSIPIQPYGSKNLFNAWQKKDNFRPTATTAFGSQWIH